MSEVHLEAELYHPFRSRDALPLLGCVAIPSTIQVGLDPTSPASPSSNALVATTDMHDTRVQYIAPNGIIFNSGSMSNRLDSPVSPDLPD
jgi:hypothetical protein